MASAKDQEKCGLIVLQGLAIKFPPTWFTENVMAKSQYFGIGTRKDCIIKYPTAPSNATLIFPPTFLGLLGDSINPVRSWFNFWMLPGASVVSPVAAESKSDLEASLKIVEANIEELINEGVPPRNIVIMGFSQGAALAIYTAIHSKHKIGGFLPIVGWLPLRKVERITELPTPVNKDTPIFQLNGMLDEVVHYWPSTKKTAKDLRKVFTKHELHTSKLGHAFTFNPSTLPAVRKWIREKTNIGPV